GLAASVTIPSKGVTQCQTWPIPVNVTAAIPDLTDARPWAMTMSPMCLGKNEATVLTQAS
ncbi:MAG: hypothetical protein ACKOBA_05725, partial [Limnohabitans sp.]